MMKYVFGRILGLAPTLFLLLLSVVLLVRLLPGNALDLIFTDTQGGQNVARQEIEHRLGLDRSILEEFVHYGFGAVRGDLGSSLWNRQPVAPVILKDLGVSLTLSVMAITLGTGLGVSIGVLSAVFRTGPVDALLRSVAILGLTIPNFALATMVIVFPTLWFRWSPPLTYTPIANGFLPHIAQFIAPAIILGFGLSAGLMRLTRAAMLEVLAQDYIRTARGKGLTTSRVVLHHALRNALLPVVSLLGVQIAGAFSGAVLLEQVFGLPGMGRELIAAVTSRDYPMIQGITVVAGMLVMFTNLVIDISYVFIDPRLRTR